MGKPIKIEEAKIGDYGTIGAFASPNPSHRGAPSRVRIVAINGINRTFAVARLQDDVTEAVIIPAGALKE